MNRAYHLFNSFMDELTNYIQETITWFILFADDVFIVDETSKGVDQKLLLWINIESKGFRPSRRSNMCMASLALVKETE